MKTMDDQYWEKAVERLDLAPGDLAEAERKLAAVEDVPVAPEEVERFVARAVGPTRSRNWWIPRVAAVVLGAMMLAAAAYWLIWEEQRYSSTTANRQGTMTYSMAIELLRDEHGNQPADARRIGLAFTWGVVSHGLATLRTIRDDTTIPTELSEASAGELARLRALVAAGSATFPQRHDGDPEAIANMALSGQLAVPERQRGVGLVAEFTATGIQALLAVDRLEVTARSEQQRYLRQLSVELNR